MAQQQGIVKGDALQKLASLGFIIGSVLLLIFNVLLPRSSDPSNVQATLKAWGDGRGLATLSAFFLAIGVWGMMIGSAGIYRAISSAGAAWARLGFYGIIVGTTIFSVSFGLISVTGKAAADWVAAASGDKAAALGTASALMAVGNATFTMSVLVFWLALFFLGIGMTRSAVYPKWAGWAALILGALNVVLVGIPQFFGGMMSTGQILFAVISVLTTIWALIVGIWVARKAW